MALVQENLPIIPPAVNALILHPQKILTFSLYVVKLITKIYILSCAFS